ncbi:MAG: hypothetical protein FWE41_06580 [Coriobacteriia bacterium]|nr:hypothetical protein [Coriobacteriia bacterium]MCL2750278.1 hypothetical protein [Coriobacteriia bacterium]
MKTCNNCGSLSFEDMEQCFDCMSFFAEPLEQGQQGNQDSTARLQVFLAGYFNYELLLRKLDGCSLSVGASSENAIVIPEQQLANHLLEVFYAHGQIWAESTSSTSQATVDKIPLCGTVRIQPGTKIAVGEATITLLEA